MLVDWNTVCCIFFCCNSRFLISDMELERKYLMKATVKVCFKDTEPCDQETVIFDNILVTKQPCEYNATYLQPGKYH